MQECNLTARDIEAITAALKRGYRVELLRDKGGNIVAQTIERKRLKTE